MLPPKVEKQIRAHLRFRYVSVIRGALMKRLFTQPRISPTFGQFRLHLTL